MTAQHDHDHPHSHDHAHGAGHAHDHPAGDPDDPEPTPPVPGPTGVFTSGEQKQARRLLIVLIIIALFFVVELVGAYAARSEVLKVDALHLLMDVFALAMSLLAMRLAVRRPTAWFTFGLRRAEPVAALFNSALVIGATFTIVREGIQSLRGGVGEPIAWIMMIVAAGALVVNGLSAWLLHGAIHASPAADGHAGHEGHAHAAHGHAHAHGGHGHALNLRGAWLHLLGDTLGSLAALVAAIIIRAGGSAAADPIASFLVAGILLAGAFRLVRDATLVLLEASPPHLPVSAVREVILAFPGVTGIHDLHVWTLGAGHDAITVHVRAADDATMARRLSKKLRDAFHVEYVTVQIEGTDDTCDAPASRFENEK